MCMASNPQWDAIWQNEQKSFMESNLQNAFSIFLVVKNEKATFFESGTYSTTLSLNRRSFVVYDFEGKIEWKIVWDCSIRWMAACSKFSWTNRPEFESHRNKTTFLIYFYILNTLFSIILYFIVIKIIHCCYMHLAEKMAHSHHTFSRIDFDGNFEFLFFVFCVQHKNLGRTFFIQVLVCYHFYIHISYILLLFHNFTI